jgi:hypothetical protein
MHMGLGIKAKREGQKKPFSEQKSLPVLQRSTGRMAKHDRLIDRDNDNYEERVVDLETGEVLHECKEPLSEHQGHGSAKIKKDQ